MLIDDINDARENICVQLKISGCKKNVSGGICLLYSVVYTVLTIHNKQNVDNIVGNTGASAAMKIQNY